MNNQPIQANQQPQQDWMEEYEGQLAIDAYQTADDLIIRAPIAGVASKDLEISVADEILSIKGERKTESSISREDYFAQECYWGSFSRSYVLPIAVDSEKTQASLKNGILTIRLPKLEKTKTRTIEVKAEE